MCTTHLKQIKKQSNKGIKGGGEGEGIKVKRITRNAIVALLFGNGSYTPGALVLGYRLKILKIKEDCILMVTSDIPKHHIRELNKYWIIKTVDYIEAPRVISKDLPRNAFRYVFTKFHCLRLTQYKKLLFMDLDYIPLSKKICHLFKLKSPSTVIEKQVDEPKNNKLIPNKVLKKVNFNVSLGLTVLTPNEEEFNAIIKDLETYDGPRFKYPEQQYLGYRWNKWYYMDLKYHCTRWEKLCDAKDCIGVTVTLTRKPWQVKTFHHYREKEFECARIWWSIYQEFLNDNRVSEKAKTIATQYQNKK